MPYVHNPSLRPGKVGGHLRCFTATQGQVAERIACRIPRRGGQTAHGGRFRDSDQPTGSREFAEPASGGGHQRFENTQPEREGHTKDGVIAGIGRSMIRGKIGHFRWNIILLRQSTAGLLIS